jgi:CheY-like chemotaxis protein
VRRVTTDRDAQIACALAAQQQAEDASVAKDRFLAVLGHELRNPLAPALTALELMKLRGSDVMTREREVLERQISHMTRLVDDLMDVSRLSRGKIELRSTRFDLRHAVDRAADMARPLIQQQRHQFRVTVPTGVVLDADEDRVVQVLVNLLTNAAKYTPPGGHLVLSGEVDDDRAIVACQDDGPGIAPDLLPTMFEPFAQGPRSFDRPQGGLGLGLALARSLTELHGGTLTYEVVHPHGSRFVLRLPIAAMTAARTPAYQPHAMIVPRRLLLVDDNVDACERLQVALERAGHLVCTAVNPVDALDLAAAFAPDVAVIDVDRSGMNGYELARRLRAMDPLVRLIALTGHGQPTDSVLARQAGFDAQCTKPVTVDALLQRIDTLESPAAI